jgi:multiple sugar transport system substrate-binding protein
MARNSKRIGMILLLGAALLTSCGGGDSPASGASGTVKVSSITVAVMPSDTERSIINALRLAYLKKYPERSVSVKTMTGATYDASILQYVTANKFPDVMQVYDFSAEYWSQYAGSGILEPISSSMSASGLSESDYYASIVKMAKSGGDDKLYWAPRDYNKVVTYINTAVFSACGIDYSAYKDGWTWEQFLSVCQTLKDNAAKAKAATQQTVFYPLEGNISWRPLYLSAITSEGGKIYENGKFFPDHAKVIAGMNRLTDLAEKGYVMDPNGNAQELFSAGMAGMVFQSRPNLATYAKTLDNAVDFLPFPSYPNGSQDGIGCTGYGIAKSSANKDAAWHFLSFIMGKDGQEVLSAMGSGIPVIRAMAEDANATFRSFISPTLNHAVFVSHEERDLPITYLSGEPWRRQNAIYSRLEENFTKGYYAASDKDAYLTNYPSNNALNF